MNNRIPALLALVASFGLASCEVDGDRHAPPKNIVTSDETIVHERRLMPSGATTTTETRVVQQR